MKKEIEISRVYPDGSYEAKITEIEDAQELIDFSDKEDREAINEYHAEEARMGLL